MSRLHLQDQGWAMKSFACAGLMTPLLEPNIVGMIEFSFALWMLSHAHRFVVISVLGKREENSGMIT